MTSTMPLSGPSVANPVICGSKRVAAAALHQMLHQIAGGSDVPAASAVIELVAEVFGTDGIRRLVEAARDRAEAV